MAAKKAAPRVMAGMKVGGKPAAPKRRGSGMGDVKEAEHKLEAQRVYREAEGRMRREQLAKRGHRMA